MERETFVMRHREGPGHEAWNVSARWAPHPDELSLTLGGSAPRQFLNRVVQGVNGDAQNVPGSQAIEQFRSSLPVGEIEDDREGQGRRDREPTDDPNPLRQPPSPCEPRSGQHAKHDENSSHELKHPLGKPKIAG